jgi:ComF family protein
LRHIYGGTGAVSHRSLSVVVRDQGRELLAALADFCWPPGCLLCGTSVDDSRNIICHACWESIVGHTVVCRRCGSGLQQATAVSPRPGGTSRGLCPDCKQVDPPFQRARSCGPHVPPLSSLLYHFKYRHRPDLSVLLSSLLEPVFRSAEWKPIHGIVAVPTTWWRSWRRGYNQADVLARELSDRIGIPYRRGALGRKGGGSQVGSGLLSRSRNVRGAFVVRDNRELLHRNILLVDDVLTTGATAKEVTEVLTAAGVRNVYLLTVTSTGRKRGWARAS